MTVCSPPIAIELQPPSTEPVHQLIEAIRNPHPEAGFAPQFNWTEYEQLLIAKNAVRGQQVYNLALAIDPACPMRAAAVQLVRNVLQEAGTILVMRPDENTTEIPDVIEVVLASHHALDWVERKSKIPTVVSKVHVDGRAELPLLSRISAHRAAGEPVPQPLTIRNRLRRSRRSPAPRRTELRARISQREKDKARAAQTVRHAQEHPKAREERLPSATENVIRVEAERIDVVLDLVGELIIAKSMMQELLAEMNRSFGNTPLRAKTADVLVFQSQILNKLQRAVMKIRMVPVEQMFRRLPRVVRDTAKQTRPRGQHRHRGREHRSRQEHSGRPRRAHDAPAAQRRRSWHRAAAGTRRRRQTARGNHPPQRLSPGQPGGHRDQR